MQSQILDGKKLSKLMEEDIKQRVMYCKEKYKETPTLATILVGNDIASKAYIKMKANACKRVSIETLEFDFKQITEENLLKLIQNLNENDNITGILIQHPLPHYINKDIDGVSTQSLKALASKQEIFATSAPLGIINLLDYYNIDFSNKKVCVVGTEQILGKPMTQMFINRSAKVIMCHQQTPNIKKYIKQADIVVASIGKPNMIKREWLKQKAIVIDAGYSKLNGKTVGDVENPDGIASFYTPVPGGVGPMTITALLSNTVSALEKKYENNEISKKQLVKKGEKRI